MKYDKNKWIRTLGIEKTIDGYEIPLSNEKITKTSTIENIYFENRKKENIKIFGEYLIINEETELKSDEIIEELKEFFDNQIRGQNIEKVTFNKKMDLKIVIDSTPKLTIVVLSDSSMYPFEKWEYNHKSGYITD